MTATGKDSTPPGLIARLLFGSGIVRRRFVRFLGLSVAALFGGRQCGRAPAPKPTLRLGVAGHLDLPERTQVTPLIERILSALREAAGPECECRVISQLAAGADQLVADRAVRLGYNLQCILPVDLDSYAQDLRRNPGVDPDPAGELGRLAAAATALLELDGEIDPAGKLTERTYETSSLTMLDHTDVLLALVRSDAEVRNGGTRWLIDEAERRAMPVIRVVLDAPDQSRLMEGPAEARCQQLLSSQEWAPRLIRSLLLQPAAQEPAGWFEERFLARATANEGQWAPNWASGSLPEQPQVRRWVADMHRDYFPYWHWAERCANAYRDLYQGAYLTISLLGLGAVGGALLGALNQHWSPLGKWLELAAITALLLLWQRAHSHRWRERWLGYRLLEQQIGNAAVLALVGRAIPTTDSPALREFQREGAWVEEFLRAVIRQANLPAGRLDAANVSAAGRLILSGMIGRQIEYYGSAIHANERANERLEKIAVWALGLTFLTAAAYLFVHYYAEEALHWPIDPFRSVALGAGIFFPALAATLAAIRTQSEFLQLATRYKGVRAHLQALQRRFARTLDDARDKSSPLLSSQVARYAEEAARAMLDEVNQWRSLLYTHEIER